MILSLLLAVTAASYEADGPIDRNQLIQLMEASRPDFQDVSFEYEGEYVYPREQQQKSQRLGPDGVSDSYSGVYVRRRDDARIIDVYCFHHKSNSATHDVVAVRGDTVEFSTRKHDSPKAKIEISRARIEGAGRGNFGSIWLRDVVLGYARSTYLYDYVGVRKHDGDDCLVVRFRLIEKEEDASNGRVVSKTFWIDLKRGGHVLHCEERWGDDLVKLMTGVRLESFEAEPGKSVWLPVAGHREGRVTLDPNDLKKPVFLDEPVYVENYRLLASSLRWNQGLKDDRFSVKAKPGDLVTDALRQARYEYGQYMVRSKAEKPKRVTDEEVEKNLDRMLKDADVLARELKASSPQREGASWLSLSLWAAAGLSGIGLIVFVVKQRLAH
jgi:dsDNA-binding SOS-regulon protein